MEVTSAIDVSGGFATDMRTPVGIHLASSEVASRPGKPPDANAILGLIDKLSQCDGLQNSGEILVTELRASLGCDTVAVGLCRGGHGHCRLQAISGVGNFDRRSELAQAIEAVFDEAILRVAATEWPAPRDSERHATRAHQSLASTTQAKRAVSSPLRNAQGDLVGAWVFLDDEAGIQRIHCTEFVNSYATFVGSLLHLHRLARKSTLARCVAGLQQAVFRWKGRLAVLVACVVLGLLCVPAPYRIGADAQIEPVVRRYVAAPFDGTLESTLVSPGDVLSQGDLLARMDAREMQWELDGLLAEYHRVSKKRDSAMADAEVAEAQLAKLEMDRIELRTQLLEHRIRHLEIRSPIDGVVVRGDLEKAEGAPLTVGQSLFEIAPLGEMVVEIAVPEDEIQYVVPGRGVVLRLEAYPGSIWNATVSKIHPRSEMWDDRNVFIAEFILADARGALRPGMKGRAKITGPRRPLAWNLFHRPYEKMAQMWGW